MRKRGPAFGVRIIHADGRDWDVVMTDARGIPEIDSQSNDGYVDSTEGRIVIRFVNPEQAKLTMIHEFLHAAMYDATEDQVRAADGVMKDLLETAGVDLDPLIRGFE